MKEIRQTYWALVSPAICFAILLLVWPMQSVSQITICGEQLDSAAYRNVIARSNGEFMGRGESCGGYGNYGLQYQCVEYIKRFYGEALGVESESWRGNAIDYFSNAEQYGFTIYRNGESRTAPSPDDLLVFSSATSVYGHVAIVTGVTSNSVSIIEQNWSRTGTASLILNNTGGKYTISSRGSYAVLGWLRRGQGGWLTFKEGNPGLPGDGLVIKAGTVPNNCCFELSFPIPLDSSDDGFTLVVFPGEGLSIDALNLNPTFETIYIVPSLCWIGSSPGIGYSGTTSFNGQKGFIFRLTPTFLQGFLEEESQTRPGCNNSLKDIYWISIQFYPPYGSLITTLDAALLIPGQGPVNVLANYRLPQEHN
jgi:hypothetical protein